MKYRQNEMTSLSGSETEKNLLKTFSGESRASNKYMLYAEKALEEGYNYVAQVFQETAGNERAHSRFVYKNALKQIKNTAQNLKDAIEGETEEFSYIYKEFEETARREGFIEIANFYKELQEVEEFHQERFKDLYDRIVSGTMFNSPDKVQNWQCMNCGYIHEGNNAPEICPLCKYPKSFFKIECMDYKL